MAYETYEDEIAERSLWVRRFSLQLGHRLEEYYLTVGQTRVEAVQRISDPTARDRGRK